VYHPGHWCIPWNAAQRAWKVITASTSGMVQAKHLTT
jgi:hypothetical protein